MKRPRLALLAGCCASVAACGGEGAPPAAEAPASRVPAELVAVHAPEIELAGTWRAEWVAGLDSTEIDVEPAADGRHVVRVRREPDYGTSFHYETRGEWRDGGLWLEGAESNTRGAVLYPARSAGEELLVPSGSLAELAAGDVRQVFRRVADPFAEALRRLEARGFPVLDATERYYLPGPEDENQPMRFEYEVER